MSEMEPREESNVDEVPKGQRFVDHIWLLFAISLLISLLVYNAWGLIELLNVPQLIP